MFRSPRLSKDIYRSEDILLLAKSEKDVAEYVARCFDYYRVKAECKHPSGLL